MSILIVRPYINLHIHFINFTLETVSQLTGGLWVHGTQRMVANKSIWGLQINEYKYNIYTNIKNVIRSNFFNINSCGEPGPRVT